MTFTPSRSWTHDARPIHRRGFTFTEIMFAVILLGIGFIMLAGMFPVAIQQTRSAVEDTTAAAVAQSAARHLQQVFSGDKLMCSVINKGDPRQLVWSLPHRAKGGVDPDLQPEERDGLYELWDRCRGAMIWEQNPRYAWVPLYRRGGFPNAPEPSAQVIIMVLESRNKQFFEPFDITQGAFEPKLVDVRRIDAGDPSIGTSDIITFSFNHGDAARDCVAEGAFVVLAQGNNTAGQIYRLGNPVGTVGQPARYNLAPAYGLVGDTLAKRKTQEITSTVSAYVIGRALTDPTRPPSASNPFFGQALDIGVYTTIIPLSQE